MSLFCVCTDIMETVLDYYVLQNHVLYLCNVVLANFIYASHSTLQALVMLQPVIKKPVYLMLFPDACTIQIYRLEQLAQSET
jgi:hypothetical protein